MEIDTAEQLQETRNTKQKSATKTSLFLINSAMLVYGNTAGPVLNRLYFLRGGKRRWLSSWLGTGGWPLLFIPLYVSYARRSSAGAADGSAAAATKAFSMKPPLFVACCALGLLTGLDNYLSAYGSSLLPVSTSALLNAPQLAFQGVFALLLVKQKYTPYSINALVLLTVGAAILGLHSDGDRPANESQSEYFVGFAMNLGAAILYAFLLPLLELAYAKSKQEITYALVIEVQLVIGIFATAFSTVGMIAAGDFKAIPKEARNLELGEVEYYMLLASLGITWQLFFLGCVGVIATSTSLHAGVLLAALIPLQEILGVLFYKERFNAEKGISLLLALWGCISYFYGEYRKKEKSKAVETQPQLGTPHFTV